MPYGRLIGFFPSTLTRFRNGRRLMHRQSKALIQDAMIASVAIVHSLTVVTRNVRDFERLGLTVLNPFNQEI